MKKKLLSICAVAALGAFTAVGFNLQNRTQLSDIALANIEAVSDGEVADGCDNNSPGPCWQESLITFPGGFTGFACIFTNDIENMCTGNYVNPNNGQLNG